MSDSGEKIKELQAKHEQLKKRLHTLIAEVKNFETELKVWQLKERGFSNVIIARQVGVSESSVRKLLKKAPREKKSKESNGET